jgi:hypothetical protein
MVEADIEWGLMPHLGQWERNPGKVVQMAFYGKRDASESPRKLNIHKRSSDMFVITDLQTIFQPVTVA